MDSFGARMLAKFADPLDIQQRQQQYEEAIALLHTAVYQEHLPGIGHEFWKTANAALEVHRHQTDQFEVAQYAMLNPTAGRIISHDGLITLLRRWTSNINDHLQQEAVLIPPLYRFAAQPPQFGQAGEEPTVALNLEPVGPRHLWQNGLPAVQPGLRRFHGTRTNVVMSIMLGGLRVSPESHGQTGVWVTGDVRLAVAWNINPLDEFPSATLQLWVSHENLVTNQEVRAGNITRGVVTPPPNCSLPNLHLESILLRIPTEDHVNWQKTFRAALSAAVQAATQQGPLLRASIFTETWVLISWRICYRGVVGSLAPDFGGPFESATPFAVNVSMVMAQILWALSVTSPRTRLRHLATVCASTIPPILQQFLNDNYPCILNHCCAPSNKIIEFGDIWSTRETLKLRRWALMRYNYEPVYE